MAKGEKVAIPVDAIVQVVVALITYGAPAISALIEDFRKDNDAEPTVDDVKALLEGLKPPGDY